MGYSARSFDLAYNYTSYSPKLDDSIFNDYSMATYGALFVYKWNPRIRLKAEYIMGGDLKATGDLKEELETAVGGYKLGVGYRLLNAVAVNFDYITHDYSSVEYTTLGGSKVKQDDLTGENIFLVSLSFPFVF